MIRLAVVSDLHPQMQSTNDGSSFVLQDNHEIRNYCAASQLFDFVRDSKIEADVLVCAGDVGDRGCPKMMEIGWKYLHKLKKTLNAKLLIAVPGNHDHDSRLQYSDYDPKHGLQSVKPYFPFEEYDLNTHFWSWNWAHKEFNNCDIFAINSSAYHGIRKSGDEFTKFDEIKHGRVSPATINTLKRKLKSIDTDAIKICVTHHHPIKNGSVTFPDYESMDGGDQLVNMLSETRGRNWLIIHGHLHWPGILNAHGASGEPPIVFSAGSLSGPLHLPYHEHITNQFYLIELDSTKTRNIGLVGTFRSWDWTEGRGWYSALSKRGLPAYGGFGYRPNLQEFADKIKEKVSSLGVEDSERQLSADRLIDEFPNILYLSPPDQARLQEILLQRGLDLEVFSGKIASLASIRAGATNVCP